MKKNWFDSKVKEFSSIGGYQKPELNENSLKLDSNENYVLSKQFQNMNFVTTYFDSKITNFIDYENDYSSLYVEPI